MAIKKAIDSRGRTMANHLKVLEKNFYHPPFYLSILDQNIIQNEFAFDPSSVHERESSSSFLDAYEFERSKSPDIKKTERMIMQLIKASNI